MLDEQVQRQIAAALKEKDALMECRRCGNNEHSIEGYFHNHIQKEVNQTVFAKNQELMPTIGLVCSKCGQIEFLALGVLLPSTPM